MISGSIPEKVTYFLRKRVKPYIYWEDLPMEEISTEVYPTYISDSENEKTLAQGKIWQALKDFNHTTKKYEEAPTATITLPNDGNHKIRIISIEFRGNGGRAYKVLLDDKYYVDLREDTLLNCIKDLGIDKGGLVKNKLIWARVNTTMKLIPVGGIIHKTLQTYEERKNRPFLKTKDLVVGGLYKDRKGEDEYLVIAKPEDSKVIWAIKNKWNDKLSWPEYLQDISAYYINANKPMKVIEKIGDMPIINPDMILRKIYP